MSITTTKQQDYSMQQEVQPLIILLKKNNKNGKVSDLLVIFPWLEIESSAI